VDAAGNLYIADRGNQRVRKVTPGNVISTVAGSGQQGFSGDGGRAIEAQLNEPTALAVDGAGNLYIAERANHRIRRVSADGVIHTVAGSGLLGFCGDGGPATKARRERSPCGPPTAISAARSMRYLAGVVNYIRRKCGTCPIWGGSVVRGC